MEGNAEVMALPEGGGRERKWRNNEGGKFHSFPSFSNEHRDRHFANDYSLERAGKEEHIEYERK